MPYRFLYPAIIVFCCIGLYTLNNHNFDIFMGALYGVVGYVFWKLRCEPAPLLLVLVVALPSIRRQRETTFKEEG